MVRLLMRVRQQHAAAAPSTQPSTDPATLLPADCEMPSHTVTVTKDFKFSPPSIESEVPCHLHFKLLPYTAAHHICVTNASTKEVVASSGPLRAGDSFSTTLVEPGRYAFSSEAYPFMHGGVHAAACPSTSSNAAASRLEAEPSIDCIKANSSAGPELSPKTEGAAAASAAQHTGKPARRSASPSKGAAAGQASTVAGQHRPAHGDHDTLAGAGSDLATTTTATTAPALVGAAGAAPGGSSSADAGAQAAPALAPLTDRCRRSSCGSDSWDLLPQQPSEQAVLELVAAGAQRQHSLPATGRGFPGVGAGSNASAAGASILQQPQPPVEGSPTPSSCCDDIVPDHAEAPTAPTAAAAAAGCTSPAELFRSGPYRRRATAYDDDHDPPTQAPTAELRAARAQLQQQQACSSQQGGSCSLTANSSSNSGRGTAAAGRQAAGEQQRPAACSMVRYAAGLEGLEISCSAIALPEHSSAAALARAGSAGSSVLLGSCRSMQHNPLDSEAEPGTASAGFSDDEEVTEFLYEPLGTDTDEGGGCAPGPAAVGYKLMRSDSSQHTSEEEPGSPGDDSGREHQQQEPDWLPRQQEQLGSEHSQEDVISEAAHLLPAARCNGSGRRVRAAWPSSSTGPAADAVLRSHSESDDSSDSDSGRDVRLRHAYGRGAAGGSSTNSSWLLGASRQQGQRHQPNGRRVERLDSAAQTSPLHGGSLRMNQPPGSSWTLGGKQVASFSSPAGHTAVEDISARHNSSSSSRASAPAAGASAAAAAKRYLGSGSSTMLGPGTHRIGRGGQLPPIGSCLEAVTRSVADTAAVLQKCSLQATQLPAKLPGAVADSACDSDGEPPSLAARLAQKQQQQKLVAANALAGSAAHSRTSSSGGSNAADSALAAAAAAAAGQGQGTKKKKKGKGKADAAAVRAAAEARAAVEARRHDRDTVECALLDNRGSSSRGDSEVCC